MIENKCSGSLTPFAVALALFASLVAIVARADDAAVDFAVSEDQIAITVGGKHFATYRFLDEGIQRPFFCDVRAPSGRQVTRNHPPVEGQDATDHATMHPGIWLAFGDLNGVDFWRNKATIRCEKAESIKGPEGGSKIGRFTVANRYESEEKVLCEEVCRITVQVQPIGYLLTLDSTFHSNDDFYFGDQEEMGLGMRVATSMTVQHGGQIVNGDGLKNEKQVWGKQADWCDYSGAVEGQPAGIALMPHPENFRRSWFHARDYGVLVANPFGKSAFEGGEKSKTVVRKGQSFRLRFGLLIHDGQIDGATAYRDYLSAAAKERSPDGER